MPALIAGTGRAVADGMRQPCLCYGPTNGQFKRFKEEAKAGYETNEEEL